MKIAHVIATFPPHFGGMGQVAFEEAILLAGAGHEVTVFTLRYPDQTYPEDQKLPFKVIRLKPFVKAGDAGFAPQLFWQLLGFDLVHLHYPFYGSAHLVYLAAKIFGFKYIVTYHMDAVTKGGKKIAQWLADLVWARAILRGARQVIAVDRDYFDASRYGRAVRSERVVELWNGVWTEIFKPGDKNLAVLKLQKFSGKKILLFIGNPLPLKRLDLILQAMKIISDPELVLIAVGEGYSLPVYQKLADQLGLSAQVEFVRGVQFLPTLAEYCRAADATVVPSDSESFSLVAIGSLACGRPVIGSNIVGLRGRLEQGVDSFLFSPGSAGDLADKIVKFFALSAEQRQTMGERGRQKVLRDYTWENHLQKLEQIYNQATHEV